MSFRFDLECSDSFAHTTRFDFVSIASRIEPNNMAESKR